MNRGRRERIYEINVRINDLSVLSNLILCECELVRVLALDFVFKLWYNYNGTIHESFHVVKPLVSRDLVVEFENICGLYVKCVGTVME